MPQNRRGNGNIYDLRQDLRRDPQRPAAPSQQSGTPAGSADGRYGFNGEPLSFKPDRTASGAPRRTRTDNSIAFPTQPRTERQSAPQRSRGQNPGRSAQRTRAASSGQNRQQAQRPQNAKKRKAPGAKNAAQQRYQNQRLRPAQQNRDPVRREKRKKRKMTRAAIKRRRMFRRLMAVVTLLAVIAAGVYLTMTMLFKIGTIEVQTEDGTVVQEAAGRKHLQL